LRPFNPLNFEFSFSGHNLGNSVRGEILLQLEKLIPSKPRSAHSIKLKIDDLSCGFSDIPPRVFPDESTAYLSLDAKDIVCQTNVPRSDTRLDVGNFRSLLYPKGSRFYFDDLYVSAYKGFLYGKGFLELRNLSPHFVFDFEFDKINMAELVKILNLEHDLAGDLGGEARLDTKAFSYLIGQADISNGHIKNVELLRLIADFLTVPSLKEIYFEDCSSNFSLSALEKEIRLDNLKLRSSDISLDADMTLGDKQKIKGHMLVRLSTRLLRESFRMRLLFLLLGESVPYADFEFRIGGFLENPHIKWLDTRFRQTIMRYLSKSGQKTIEKKVEDAIKPLLEGKQK